MDVIPREELIDLGKLHLKTNQYLESLMCKNQALLRVTQNSTSKRVTLDYSFVWAKGNTKESHTVNEASFCEAVKALADKVNPPTRDNGTEARLTRIEEALEALADKVKG